MEAMAGNDHSRLELPFGPGTTVSWILRISTGGEADPVLVHVGSVLKIEQAIEERLSHDANEVVGIVHTLTSRELHYRDGSTVVFSWEPQVSDWRCADCGIDTDEAGEYYMLHDPIWREAAHHVKGHLCIGCVEHRLGRHLTAADFTDRPVNTAPHIHRSPRLMARISSHE